MKPWKRSEPTKVHKIGHRKIVEKTFELPDGTESVFGTMEQEGSIASAVVALTRDNKIVIARQFRPGPQKVMDELPGGGVETGEDPELAVRRELLEETGYKADAVEFLGTVYKSAYINTLWHYYVARGCIKIQDQQLDDTEFVDVVLLSPREVLDNARSGNMTDSEAVLLMQDELKTLIENGALK